MNHILEANINRISLLTKHRLKCKYQELSKELNKTSQELLEISQDYNDLAYDYEALGLKNMYGIFNSFSLLFNSLAKSYRDSQKVISHDFEEFFKFYKSELTSFNELNKKCEEINKDCVTFKSNLLAKKEKLFKEGVVSKWGVKDPGKETLDISCNKDKSFKVMLHEETKILEEKENLCGYFNNKLLEEIERVYKKNKEAIIDHFAIVCKFMINVKENVYICNNNYNRKLKNGYCFLKI